MKVYLEKEVAEDLIGYKLRNIQENIQKILKRWNETEASVFLEKAKNGTYYEAENDAIDLKQLMLEEKQLNNLFDSFQEQDPLKGLNKLAIARKILLNELLSKIKNEYIDDERPFLKITFFKGTILYIRYNDYDEYSYQLIFSQEPLDRIRYDNYDDMWKVKSSPHHFHLTGEKTAIKSPMNGDPEHDIPILLKEFFEKKTS